MSLIEMKYTHFEKQISDTQFEFSARLEIDYLNTTYSLNLPEDENYEINKFDSFKKI